MNLIDIKNLIAHGESHTLEFKKTTGQLKAACESICALLNAGGGMVIIGVTDDQRILGQEISDKTKREIGNEIAKIAPFPLVEIIYIALPSDDKYLIVLRAITDNTRKPYLYNGRAFVRIESDTLPMSREDLQHFTISNASHYHAWECQTQPHIMLKDLDEEEIIITIKEGVSNGRIPENYSTDDPKLALKRLNLIQDNKLTNAALVLFGKHPEIIFPQCLLRLARFRGINKAEFIDSKQITGNIFKLINAAMEFTSIYLPIASTFPPGSLQRKDVPLFPIVALREAIANAICHRDYSYHGGSVSLAIYDDRIEIWNYGLLPPGISVEHLKTLNQSVPRNRLIANVLYYHKIFESWGRGVQMILTECKQAGHPEPFYSQNAGGTVLTLPSSSLIGHTSSSQATLVDLSSAGLSIRQKEIIMLLSKHPFLSPNDLRSLMPSPLPERTLRDELNRLKVLGFVDMTGQTRARKWFIKT